MKDLVLHKNDSFQIPDTYTSDGLQQIVQSYITLFLTTLASVSLEPTLGSVFSLGDRNTVDVRFMIQEINSDLSKQIEGIVSLSIVDLEEISDSVKVTIAISTIYGDRTLEIAV